MLLKIVAFVIPLGFDTLAVAIALGLRDAAPLRPALTFAVFEALMPLIGLIIGAMVGARFETLAAAIGGIVLVLVALYIAKEAMEDDDETEGLSFSSLRTATIAGFGISIDELAVGFPMGTSGLPVPQTLGAIALQAFIVTYGGIALGKRLSEAFGRKTSRAAGFAAAATFGGLGIYLILERVVPGLPQL